MHLVGIGIHLPKISSPWPWQTISKGVSANTAIGPWVLQKIQGISSPALGRADFTFYFTHKVSKDIGPLPCWYASTFYAVGHASATVDLNPGPGWWAPATGHYRLRVASVPHAGTLGKVAIAIVLPRPRLPRSADDVAIDNIASQPIATDHSWTYAGLLCGSILRPQFPESVLYAQAQQIAFYKSTHSPQITRELVAAAQGQAARMMRDNFIQPTVNALGYTLTRFSVSWS